MPHDETRFWPLRRPSRALEAQPSNQSDRKHLAAVRHRTGKTKGRLSRRTGLATAFKLMTPEQGTWRKLDGSNRMPETIRGVAFAGGIKQRQPDAYHASSNFRAWL